MTMMALQPKESEELPKGNVCLFQPLWWEAGKEEGGQEWSLGWQSSVSYNVGEVKTGWFEIKTKGSHAVSLI